MKLMSLFLFLLLSSAKLWANPFGFAQSTIPQVNGIQAPDAEEVKLLKSTFSAIKPALLALVIPPSDQTPSRIPVPVVINQSDTEAISSLIKLFDGTDIISLNCKLENPVKANVGEVALDNINLNTCIDSNSLKILNTESDDLSPSEGASSASTRNNTSSI